MAEGNKGEKKGTIKNNKELIVTVSNAHQSTKLSDDLFV